MTDLYGVDCMTIPEAAVMAYAVHERRIRMRRAFAALIAAGKQPTVDDVYELALEETGSKDEAEEQASRWAEAVLRADGG